jgi:hypothetical protein
MTDSIDRIHFQELSELDPMDVCRRALCHYDASNRWYTLSVWGTELRITPHRLTIESMSNNKHHLDEYFHLFAIHYLLGARVTDLANEWISEKDVAGGATFFRGPHRIPTDLIADRFNNNIDAFKARCNRFGGRSIQLADAAYVFTITPRIRARGRKRAADQPNDRPGQTIRAAARNRDFGRCAVGHVAVGADGRGLPGSGAGGYGYRRTHRQGGQDCL